MKTLSKRATLTEQQRHRLGSGSFEWRPETAESAWWTVLDCLPKRSSPEWGAACQNRGAARLCTARAGHEAALRKEAPRGAERGCLQAIPWSLGPLRAECCHRLRRRRRPARRRHRRLRHRRLVATTAAVAEPAAAAAAALAVAAFAVAPLRRAEVEKASPPATLVMSLAERPQLHGLIPRDVDACRAIVAEQTERIARMVNGF